MGDENKQTAPAATETPKPEVAATGAAPAEKPFWDRIKEAFGKDTEVASKKFDELTDESKKLATEYYEYAKNSEAGKKVMSMAEYAKDKGIELGKDALKATEDFWDTYAPQGLKDAAKKTGNALGDAFSGMGDFLGGNAKSLGVGLLGAIGVMALAEGIGLVGALLIGLLIAGIASAAGMDGENGMLSGLLGGKKGPGGPDLKPGVEVAFGLDKDKKPVWDKDLLASKSETLVKAKVAENGQSLIITGIASKNKGNGQFPVVVGSNTPEFEDVSAQNINVALSAAKDHRPNVEDPAVQDAISRATLAAQSQKSARMEAAKNKTGAPTGQFNSAETKGPDGAAVSTPAGNPALTAGRGPESAPAASH